MQWRLKLLFSTIYTYMYYYCSCWDEHQLEDISGWMEKWREKERKEAPAPKMCFIKMCIQHTHQMLVPQTGGPASSPLPSQGYQFERKMQGTQIFPFVAFIRLILTCLPKLARGAVSQQHHTNFCEQGLGAFCPLSEERHVSMRDTWSLLDTDTSWFSPSSISNPVTSSCLSPLVLQFHTLLLLCTASLIHKASSFNFRSLLESNSW